MFGWATQTDDLAQLLNSVQTMRANFKKVIFDNHDKTLQTSYGRISMQRPGKFRWEVTKPIPQVIVANASRLWIYDPDLEQVTVRSLDEAAGDTPALLLSHVDTVLEKTYRIKAMPSKKADWQWFALTPKKTDGMFASIQMGFQHKQIKEMRLQDQLGHSTTIEFSDVKTNIPIAASQFVMKPPANTDVIDETKK